MKTKKNNRFLALLTAFTVLLTMFPIVPSAYATDTLQGSGTVSDPYLISNAVQLGEFRDMVNGGEVSICGKLMNDIVLNEDLDSKLNEDDSVKDGETVSQWTPISNDIQKYSGTFDGNGHKIIGMYINQSNGSYQGLFGYIDQSGTVKNLGVDGTVKGKLYVGGVVGINSGTVDTCYNTGKVSDTGGYVGGVVGINGGTVDTCYNTGKVSGTGSFVSDVGGVVGRNNGEINTCYNTGDVSSTGSNVGGVVGSNSGTVDTCYNTGKVSGESLTGGVVGSNSGTVDTCYNTGKVSGNEAIGGIAGVSDGGTIINCYNTADISTVYTVGGIVGYNAGTVDICYNTGKVSGNEEIGGVVGYNTGSGTIQKCYYLAGTAMGGISGNDQIGQAVSLTSEKMTGSTALNYMSEFDASNWYIAEDSTVIGIKTETEQQYTLMKYFPHLTAFKGRTNPHGIVTGSFKQMQKDENDFYLIYTKEQLETFRNIVNNTLTNDETQNGYTENLSAKGKLMNDIVLNEDLDSKLNEDGSVKDGETVSQWTPISNSGRKYSGIFDGDGYKISGLYINQSNSLNQGLFGYIDKSGTVKNLGVDGAVKGNLYVGGIAGYNGGTVDTCYNTGNVSGIGSNVGGVVGQNTGVINTCYNTGNVSSTDRSSTDVSSTDSNVGGVVGINNGTVDTCYNTGNVSGKSVTGGIAGVSNGGTIINCYNTADISASYDVGGVVGRNTLGTVKDCYNIGNVGSVGQNSQMAGGIVGFSYYGYGDNVKGIISNCYNKGEVNGNNYIGGVVGNNVGTPINNCYNTGNVNGNDYIGGITGCEVSSNGKVSNCYNIGKISGTTTRIGSIVGESSAQSIINCYYLKGTADVGIGKNNNSDSDKIKTTELDIDKMTGANAISNMSGFDAKDENDNDIWYTTPNELIAGTKTETEQQYTLMKYFPHLTVFKGRTNPYGIVTGSFEQMQKDENDFYLIYTKEQLETFRNIVNNTLTTNEIQNGYTENLSAKGKLMNDIVLNEDLDSKLNEDGSVKDGETVSQWIPISNNKRKYSGTFDGNGHKIIGLYINQSNSDYQGLFGYIDQSGTIKNLGVDGTVKGKKYVGGIVGYKVGTVDICYNTGDVSGNENIGGIAGYNTYTSSTVSNCYNTGKVSGTGSYVGGIVGYNAGTVDTCYNTGKVSGNETIGGIAGYSVGKTKNSYNIGNVSGKSDQTEYVGSIVGCNMNSSITDCYYLKGTADKGVNGKITQQTRLTELEVIQMVGENALKNMSALDGNVWYTMPTESITVTESSYEQSGTYKMYFPHLTVFKDKTLPSSTLISTVKMKKDADDFYLIYTKEQLETFCNIVNNTLTTDEIQNGYTENLSAKGKLMNDIVLNEDLGSKLNEDGSVKDGETVNQWTPISNNERKYSGIFDGNGYKISGLYINQSNSFNQGLFGYIDQNGTVKNLGVDGTVKEKNYVGGIAGYNAGTIDSCYNTGDVGGDDYIGGIAGCNAGKVDSCYNTGDVSGDAFTGGIAGCNDKTVSNCYNTGDVGGSRSTGGIAGRNNNTVSNCYSTGNAGGDYYIGGIAGYNNGEATNCYYLKGTANKGLGYGKGEATEKTVGELEDGTVLNLLIGSQTNHMWDNKCKNFVNENGKPVLQPVFVYQKLGLNNPQYTIIIPETVDVGTEFKITANTSQMTQKQYVDVSADIPTDGLELVNDIDSSVVNKVFLYSGNNIVTESAAQFGNGINLESSALCFKPDESPRAGRYNGTATFTISLKEVS